MRTPSLRSSIWSVALLTLLGTSALQAQTPVLTFTAGSGVQGANYDQTVGWQFNVLSGITLDGFEWYDDGGDGLSIDHMVGIWNPAGVLLSSVLIPAGTSAPLSGSFRIASVSDLFLAPGSGYILGGQNSTASTDFLSYNVSGLDVNPAIAFGNATFSNADGSFERPTQFSGAVTGFFGPSFTVAPESTVPEPATMTLLATGLVGLAAARRKKRRTA